MRRDRGGATRSGAVKKGRGDMAVVEALLAMSGGENAATTCCTHSSSGDSHGQRLSLVWWVRRGSMGNTVEAMLEGCKISGDDGSPLLLHSSPLSRTTLELARVGDGRRSRSYRWHLTRPAGRHRNDTNGSSCWVQVTRRKEANNGCWQKKNES